MGVVQVSGGLERSIAKLQERLVRLSIPTLLHQPARRLWYERDAETERDGGDECGSELKTPGNRTSVHDAEISHETEEDAKGRPHLPAHDETATDAGWTHLSREDRHSDFLEPHANTEEETTDDELRPALREARPKRRKQREDSRDEDGPLAANQVVDRIRDPSRKQRNRNIRARIDESDNPAVLLARPSRRTRSARVWDPKRLAESQVRAVGTRLVPALDRGRDRVEDDGEVQHARQLEAVRDFFADGLAVAGIEFLDLLVQRGRLREEGAFDQERLDVLQAVLGGEAVDVGEELGL